MKKIINIVIIMLCFISIPVFAEETAPACGIIGDITYDATRLILIAAPIILIIMGTIDFLGAVTASDEKMMKKATSNLIKRFIICVVIFLLPMLVNFVVGWTTLNNFTACFHK